MTQYFKDTGTGEIRLLDDAVVATKQADGAYSFLTEAGGMPMNMPTTLVPITAAEYQILTAKSETATDIDVAVQAELDQMAQRRGYQDAATCVSYMNSTNTTWKVDATAMNKYRDDAWTYAIAQEAITPLPSVTSVLSGIAALTSNPGW